MAHINAYFRLALCAGVLMGASHVFALDVEGKGALKTYDVVSGDTLDKVIRATMADSPLKIELLRTAFIQQNPQAFTKTPPRTLMAGSILTIPDHDSLVAMYLKSGKSAPPKNAQGSASSSGPHTASGSGLGAGGYATTDLNMNERKNWVRFP
jgi:Tfp pilus assembly protein FimV